LQSNAIFWQSWKVGTVKHVGKTVISGLPDAAALAEIDATVREARKPSELSSTGLCRKVGTVQ
jgi:hypothetical protein